MNRAFRIAAVVLTCLSVSLLFSSNRAYAPIVDPCKSFVSATTGIALVCPAGDGDSFSSVGITINLTVRDSQDSGIAGIPRTDMWLVGCNDKLLLCGGSQGSNPDAATNALGQTTFSNEPNASGCETGVYVVVQGLIILKAGCVPNCLPMQLRSPDYKSSGAPGPPPCGLDTQCPDGKVSMADYTWFTLHYPNWDNPGAPYLACADFATPYSSISLADYSRFIIHYTGTGHRCPFI